MSSTTDRPAERGQVLVLFAGALVTLMLIGALAFDVGMMLLERRDQQNAADAAALAAARYVITSPDYSGTCAGAVGNPAAEAACELADDNGFSASDAAENVTVHIPPIDGIYAGLDGFVEVKIDASRPSIFGGVIGRATWPVGTFAVAGNQQGVEVAFGMLALDFDECKAVQVAGTGVVDSEANVFSNSDGSDCTGDPIGFSVSGSGTLDTEVDSICGSMVEIQVTNNATVDCAPQVPSPRLPDPLMSLAIPAKTTAPPLREVVGGLVVDAPANVPDYCPGASNPARQPSEANPRKCVLGQGGSQANRDWILGPGLYPGGLEFKGGVTVYMLPGIYWIGGGGFQASNDVDLISVESETNRAGAVCPALPVADGASTSCTGGGGVLIYNSFLTDANGNVTSAAGTITMGGGGATLRLMPYLYPFADPSITTDDILLVIWQDRRVGLTVTLNGSSAQASQVRGILYVPGGELKVNGSSSAMAFDQVIAKSFYISGSGGTIYVLHENAVDAEISGVGLVQ